MDFKTFKEQLEYMHTDGFRVYIGDNCLQLISKRNNRQLLLTQGVYILGKTRQKKKCYTMSVFKTQESMFAYKQCESIETIPNKWIDNIQSFLKNHK